MVQLDGFEGNPCTCFMFMKPSDKVKQMLALWLKAISEAEAQINQVRFSPQGLHERDILFVCLCQNVHRIYIGVLEVFNFKYFAGARWNGLYYFSFLAGGIMVKSDICACQSGRVTATNRAH